MIEIDGKIRTGIDGISRENEEKIEGDRVNTKNIDRRQKRNSWYWHGENPTPKDDGKQIVALVKDRSSNIHKEAGVALAKPVGIRGVGISERKGNEYPPPAR